MRALLSEAAGPAERLVLRDVPEPNPHADEVRIRVHACGINYPDVLIIEDRYQYRPHRPFSPGGEVAGVVEAIGPDVRDVQIGQRVAAFVGWGGLAEKVIAHSTKVLQLPDEMDFGTAAGTFITYGTSLHALKDRGNLQRGERLLVLGASGGVGFAAVELGRIMGATVVAAVSSEAKAAALRDRGIDNVVIYPESVQDARALSAQLKTACGDGAHVIYDAVGGAYAEPALRAIAWEGRYLIVGFPAGIPKLPANLLLLKGCAAVGVFWGAAFDRAPLHHRALLKEVAELYTSGQIKPLISSGFSLESGPQAIAALQNRVVIGKIIVNVV